jgi:hypothetical protein
MAKITSNINARSKKSKAELAAIAKKKSILDDNEAGKQALKSMDSDIANRKKEKKDFLNLTAKDRSKMSLDQLIELHRRQRDLGSTSATKNYNKGGIVKMQGGGKIKMAKGYSAGGRIFTGR